MLKVHIREDERGLLYEEERFVKVLDVGTHNIFSLFKDRRVERVPADVYGVGGEKARRLYEAFREEVSEAFDVVQSAVDEAIMVYIDNKPAEILPPGELKLYFRRDDIVLRRINVASRVLATPEEAAFCNLLPKWPEEIALVQVPQGSRGFVYVDGVRTSTLEAGRYVLYGYMKNVHYVILNMRVCELELARQEVLSADKVTLRCNVTMHYRIVDAARYLDAFDDSENYLYRQLQMVLRRYVGTHSVDDLLEKTRYDLDETHRKVFENACAEAGVEVVDVMVRDIVLPGEMRDIFNRLIAAEKEAKALTIKRREETAAMRSQLNTARLMKDNPVLMRLKELDAMESIAEKIESLHVYGGLEEMLGGMVRHKTEKNA